MPLASIPEINSSQLISIFKCSIAAYGTPYGGGT